MSFDRIVFVAFVSVNMANANGDPLNGNRPRTDYNGFGEMSDVCVKRKIRNRMQDLGYSIFVQSDDKRSDEFGSLSERASAKLGKIKEIPKKTERVLEALEKENLWIIIN